VNRFILSSIVNRDASCFRTRAVLVVNIYADCLSGIDVLPLSTPPTGSRMFIRSGERRNFYSVLSLTLPRRPMLG
jgi:hypothetical protein